MNLLRMIFFICQTYSVGVSVIHNNNFAADYSFENWSVLNIGGDGWQTVNNNRVSAGGKLRNTFSNGDS
jgi:hypothetical protein